MFPRSSEVQTSESWLQLSLQFVSNMKKTNRQTKRFVPPQHNMTQRQVVPTSHLLLQCETEPHFYVHAPARRWNICKSNRLKPNDVSGRIPSQSDRNLVSSKSEWPCVASDTTIQKKQNKYPDHMWVIYACITGNMGRDGTTPRVPCQSSLPRIPITYSWNILPSDLDLNFKHFKDEDTPTNHDPIPSTR